MTQPDDVKSRGTIGHPFLPIRVVPSLMPQAPIGTRFPIHSRRSRSIPDIHLPRDLRLDLLPSHHITLATTMNIMTTIINGNSWEDGTLSTISHLILNWDES